MQFIAWFGYPFDTARLVSRLLDSIASGLLFLSFSFSILRALLDDFASQRAAYTMDMLIDTADLPWRASATLDGGGGLSVTLRGIAKLPSAALPPPAATDRPAQGCRAQPAGGFGQFGLLIRTVSSGSRADSEPLADHRVFGRSGLLCSIGPEIGGHSPNSRTQRQARGTLGTHPALDTHLDTHLDPNYPHADPGCQRISAEFCRQ
jgi:hypothetical protein